MSHSPGSGPVNLSVKRDGAGNIEVKVEWMKDGPEGAVIYSRLEAFEVGTDEDGEPITSCIVLPVEINRSGSATGTRLTPNQQTMFAILRDAGSGGLTTEQWNEQARAVDIGRNARRIYTTFAPL